MFTPTPVEVERHLINDGDTPHETTAICSHGDYRFTSADRNERMRHSYQHLADVFSSAA